MKTPTEYKAAKVYTLKKDIKVRKGAGLNRPQKLYSELTPKGRTNAYEQKYAVLKAGSKVVSIKVIKNGKEVWLMTPDGYILAQTEKETYIC
jgi:hypothetical protein